MAKVNRMIIDEQKNKQKINYSEAIKDLKDGSYDKMMVGGKQSSAQKACGGDKPCPAEKSCGADKPCPAEKVAEKPCGADHPCPAEKPCGAGKPCPANQGEMVIDPNTADMIPAALLSKSTPPVSVAVVSSSEKIEKPSAGNFNIDTKVSDTIGFIQQFALKQELKTESLIQE